MMAKSQNKLANGRGFADLCKVCGKEGMGRNIKDHIEANHLEGIIIPCNLCDKTFRSRAGFRQHKHKNETTWEQFDSGISIICIIQSKSPLFVHLNKHWNIFLQDSLRLQNTQSCKSSQCVLMLFLWAVEKKQNLCFTVCTVYIVHVFNSTVQCCISIQYTILQQWSLCKSHTTLITIRGSLSHGEHHGVGHETSHGQSWGSKSGWLWHLFWKEVSGIAQ